MTLIVGQTSTPLYVMKISKCHLHKNLEFYQVQYIYNHYNLHTQEKAYIYTLSNS